MTKDQNVVLAERIKLKNSGAEVLLVTLNRPDRLNCFNAQVCHSLCKIFSQLNKELHLHDAELSNSKEPIVAVILTGAGRSFCAGADLTNPPNPLEQSSDLVHHLERNPVFHMGKISVPIIGAVQGHCYTGGFELALACDILIGDSTTRFKDTHVKFGLAPCWGLSQRLQRRIGPGRAKLVSLTASTLSGEKAYEWGLLDDFVKGSLVEEANSKKNYLLERALEISENIAQNDGKMVRRYKRAIVEGGMTDLQKGLQRERELAFSHYWEAVGDQSETFQDAKRFINDETRPRSKL